MDIKKPLPSSVNFLTAGLGGVTGWCIVHPLNTAGIRLNLQTLSNPSSSDGIRPKSLSFPRFLKDTIRDRGILSLYDGLGAGILRQIFYTTSRFGLFEVFRDELAKYRKTDLFTRLLVGSVSGGIAALISCPAEVTLVRISNDASLPVNERRNYKGVIDAFVRIFKEEGPKAFFNGFSPFVNRAMLVGAVQVGTYDQFRVMYRDAGIKHEFTNVFYASMTSGLIFAVVTAPFETAKNRMAFQKPDLLTGQKVYRTTLQTIRTVAKNDGTLALWSGFSPYYLRCGGQTVFMFIAVEYFRNMYKTYRTV